MIAQVFCAWVVVVAVGIYNHAGAGFFITGVIRAGVEVIAIHLEVGTKSCHGIADSSLACFGCAGDLLVDAFSEDRTVRRTGVSIIAGLQCEDTSIFRIATVVGVGVLVIADDRNVDALTGLGITAVICTFVSIVAGQLLELALTEVITWLEYAVSDLTLAVSLAVSDIEAEILKLAFRFHGIRNIHTGVIVLAGRIAGIQSAGVAVITFKCRMAADVLGDLALVDCAGVVIFAVGCRGAEALVVFEVWIVDAANHLLAAVNCAGVGVVALTFLKLVNKDAKSDILVINSGDRIHGNIRPGVETVFVYTGFVGAQVAIVTFSVCSVRSRTPAGNLKAGWIFFVQSESAVAGSRVTSVDGAGVNIVAVARLDLVQVVAGSGYDLTDILSTEVRHESFRDFQRIISARTGHGVTGFRIDAVLAVNGKRAAFRRRLFFNQAAAAVAGPVFTLTKRDLSVSAVFKERLLVHLVVTGAEFASTTKVWSADTSFLASDWIVPDPAAIFVLNTVSSFGVVGQANDLTFFTFRFWTWLHFVCVFHVKDAVR